MTCRRTCGRCEILQPEGDLVADVLPFCGRAPLRRVTWPAWAPCWVGATALVLIGSIAGYVAMRSRPAPVDHPDLGGEYTRGDV